MARRQPVPAALREELIEYSSLLRALRTTQTLDVTAHLTEPYANDKDKDEDDEIGPSRSTTPAASTGTDTKASSSKRKRSESKPQTPHWRNRDQWTRWPIPVKDVPLPDWSLQDEIATIVKHVLAPTNLESSSPSYEGGDDDDGDLSDEPAYVKGEQIPEFELNTDSEDEGDTYYQTLAETITPVIQNKLESLFALVSAHTMARPDSMQNRIEPFDWRDLINILGSPGAAHLVDETILQNVTSRMEELFETTPASTSTSVPPPSPATAIHRHRVAQSSRSHLNSLLSKHTTSLFEQTLPPPNHKYLTSYQISLRRKKQEKKRKKKRRISASQDDEDIDEAKAGTEVEVDDGDDDSGTSKGKGKGTDTNKAQSWDKRKGRAEALRRTASTSISKYQGADDNEEGQEWESKSTEDEEST